MRLQHRGLRLHKGLSGAHYAENGYVYTVRVRQLTAEEIEARNIPPVVETQQVQVLETQQIQALETTVIEQLSTIDIQSLSTTSLQNLTTTGL